jgi:predicted RNA-binding protein with PIN domain
MPYLIDGHNLIPKIPSLDLQEIDDEIQLIQLLQVFCQKSRKKVEVFFDQASAGQSRVHNYGMVTAHFVHKNKTADQMIEQRLNHLGGNATNYTVVSSDRRVQAAGRAVKAKVLSSEAFSKHLLRILNQKDDKPSESEDHKLSDDEIEQWIQLFKERQ